MNAPSGREGAQKGVWAICEECGGLGFHAVPDNGTNNGEEECQNCAGSAIEGRVLVDEWGDKIDD